MHRTIKIYFLVNKISLIEVEIYINWFN